MMKAWGIKAKQTVERKESSEVGVVTKRYDVDVWYLIHGMGAGAFTSKFECDCMTTTEFILNERIPSIREAIKDGHIKSFEIVVFEVNETETITPPEE